GSARLRDVGSSAGRRGHAGVRAEHAQRQPRADAREPGGGGDARAALWRGGWLVRAGAQFRADERLSAGPDRRLAARRGQVRSLVGHLGRISQIVTRVTPHVTLVNVRVTLGVTLGDYA